MRAFSQLLDDLVYTRSRNTKLKLIGDYLKATPDPDRGIALAALTGSLSIPAVKGAAVRAHRRRTGRSGAAAHEPRLCRRHGRDGGAAVADRRRRRARDRRRHHPHLRRGRAPRHRQPDGRAAACLPACSTISTRRAASRCSSSPPAACASAFPRGWPSRRSPTPSGSTSMRSRRSGTASARPIRSCSTGRRAAGRSRRVRDVPVFRPFMLAHPLEETKVSLDDYAAEWKWDGIRVQLVRAAGQTRLYSRTGDDISGSFPDVAEALRPMTACSTASCWCAAASRAPTSMAAPRPASTRSSSGSAARTSAPRCRTNIPPSSASTTS